MSEILHEGDKVLVCHRRLFERDEERYFVGRLTAYDAGVLKVSGWTYLREFASGKVVRKDDLRTKLYSLASGTILVYQLPDATELDALEFTGNDGHVLLTDGSSLRMNLSERFLDLSSAA